MMGSAAFLFPDGRMVPERVCHPSTTNCSALMRDGAVDEEGLDEDRAARSVSSFAPPVAEWRSLDMTGLRNQVAAQRGSRGARRRDWVPVRSGRAKAPRRAFFAPLLTSTTVRGRAKRP